MTHNIATLGELLAAAGTQWRVYDIGRRITKIDKQEFAQIEQSTRPYPYPLQRHAHIAIQFWDKSATQDPYVWFLKLPLDEQSKLVLASRDHFANMVIEAIGTQLTGEQAQGKLDNNPYVFTPNANKLAAFNALMKVELKRPASQYYEAVEHYFSAPLIHDWQTLALQGIADFAMRLNHGNNLALLQQQFTALPEQVQQPLCAMLEHVAIPVTLSEMLLRQLQNALEQQHQGQAINCLRALSGAPTEAFIATAIDAILASELSSDTDVLLTISGRGWQTLTHSERLFAFLEQTAQVPLDGFFAGIFADLVAIPTLRPHVLAILRAPSRSDSLSRAIGKLFSA
ncbi:DUF3549 family protein [Pseudoalteromonas fenneropenaei]|uniref:DUF3549 family protein n=1 Tax=Pseudoalteromonas fenneropenaei TaxID=1737459 RepID=A0ABV7CGB2_9GAMM